MEVPTEAINAAASHRASFYCWTQLKRSMISTKTQDLPKIKFMRQSKRSFAKEALFLIIAFSVPVTSVFASRAGRLDPTFGTGGLAGVDIGGFNPSTSRDMVVQTDGKIIIVGSSRAGQNTIITLTRFTAEGGLDDSFGSGGVVTTDLTSLADDTQAVALQSNGKIVIAGHVQRIVPGQKGWVLDVAVVRYNSNGSLDATFDNDGIVITQFGNFTEVINDVAVQPDGKILVAGSSGSALLLRYNTNGSLDTSFDGDGVAQNAPVFVGIVNSMALQPDGKILLSGHSHTDNIVLRYNSNGTIDTSFDTDGAAVHTVGTSVTTHGMSLQPDGKILLTGSARVNIPSRTEITVMRLNTNGSRDTHFDGDGLAVTEVPGMAIAGDDGWDVHMRSDRKIVVIGFSVQNPTLFVILRYKENGSLDTSFDFDGMATSLLGGGNVFAFQTDRKILVAGGSLEADLIVSRFVLHANLISDFNNDGRTDVSVFRPSNGIWWVRNSISGNVTATHFGLGSDLIIPADYDGDGKTDIAVFRPSNGDWYLLRSSDGTFSGVHWGLAGDVPVPGNYDGDGKADIAIFRPSSGDWWILLSNNGGILATHFGTTGDKPTLGDFDDDGRTDIGVFRPSNGAWYRLDSSTGAFFFTLFGISEDKPVPADYDGDEKTDVAVFRPSTGTWHWISSRVGSPSSFTFGSSGDRPSPADYDGDGRVDFVFYRPSEGRWYFISRFTGIITTQAFGLAEDVPTPSWYVQ